MNYICWKFFKVKLDYMFLWEHLNGMDLMSLMPRKNFFLNESLANLTLFECCEIDWGHHFVFVDRPFFRK